MCIRLGRQSGKWYCVRRGREQCDWFLRDREGFSISCASLRMQDDDCVNLIRVVCLSINFREEVLASWWRFRK